MAVNGVATFSGLTIRPPGFRLHTRRDGQRPHLAATNAITVTAPGVANQLVVKAQPPASVVAGSGFGLVVEAEDSFGTVDSTFQGTLAVSEAGGVAWAGPSPWRPSTAWPPSLA